jgi:hypothetical protein
MKVNLYTPYRHDCGFAWNDALFDNPKIDYHTVSSKGSSFAIYYSNIRLLYKTLILLGYNLPTGAYTEVYHGS